MNIRLWITIVALGLEPSACTSLGGGSGGESTGGANTEESGTASSTVSASGMHSGTKTTGDTATTGGTDSTTSDTFGTGTDSGEPPEGEFGCWTIDALIEEPDVSGGAGVAARQDGIRAGTMISSGTVYATDLDGVFQWEYEIPGNLPASVMAVAMTADGGVLAAAQSDDLGGGGPEVWLGRLSAAGSLEWETSLGPTSDQTWTTAHMATLPGGDVLVAWDREGGLGVTRVDPSTGTSAWSELTNYAPSLINWSRGGLAVTPAGDALSLLRHASGLELELRSGADGMLLTSAVVTDPAFADATPADLEVLEDGTIFVLANAGVGPSLLEVGLDGSVVASHTFTSIDDPFANVMAWDPVTEQFLLSGTGRLPSGTQRPWRLTTDRNGATELDVLGGMPFSIGDGLDSAPLPDGGFVETRFPSLFAYAITCR